MDTGTLKATVKMLGPIAWIALAAGLQMIGAFLLFRAPFDLVLFSTTIFITFGIYMLNRFTDKEDGYNYPEQRLYFQEKWVLIGIPISLIMSSYILLSLTKRLSIWHIILITVGLLYSVHIIPIINKKSIKFIRFKDIFLVKNIVVSLLWSIIFFAFAASLKNVTMPPSSVIALAIATCFFPAFINTVSSDVCDEKGDRFAGVVTIATRFGKKTTGFVVLGVGIFGCLSAGLFYFSGNVGKPIVILLCINLVWTAIVTWPVYIKHSLVPKSLLKPLLDTQQIFVGISLIICSKYIWQSI